MKGEHKVYVVDDDAGVRDSLSWLIESVGLTVESYESAQSFLESFDGAGSGGCLLLDVRLRDMSGLDVQDMLASRGTHPPIIFITGHGDIPMAVEAMKKGAVDFITKPVNDQKLLDTIQRVLAQERSAKDHEAQREAVARRVATLSPREREVLGKVVEGKLNKVIADEMGISSKTVEAHRARLMEKMAARNAADLIRQVLSLEEFSAGGSH